MIVSLTIIFILCNQDNKILKYTAQEIADVESAFAYITSASCTDFCKSGGYGEGLIIGTAVFCNAMCARDCSKTHCTIASSYWSDYGQYCWSGNKICCCGKCKY